MTVERQGPGGEKLQSPSLGLTADEDRPLDHGAKLEQETAPDQGGINRSRLVGPVFVILLISFLSIIGFVWSGTNGLNREAKEMDRRLAMSLLEIQWTALKQISHFISSSPEVTDHLGADFDRAWVDREIGHRLYEEFQFSSTWVIDAEGHVRLAYLRGLPAGQSLPQVFSPQLDEWLSLNRERIIESGRSYGTFARQEEQIDFVAVSRIGPATDGLARAHGGDDSLLVLSLPVHNGLFAQDGRDFTLEDLAVTTEAVPDGYEALPLKGVGGETLGHMVWAPKEPGDRFLRPLSPVIGIGLIAIAYFLLRFIKGADFLMERQAALSAALRQEQNLRTLKSRFLSMVSHELRTPLAAIRSATEVLERYGDRMSEKDRQDEHRAIHKSVDALSKLVDNVLVLGKSDWVADQTALEDIEVADFVRDTWDETVGPLYDAHLLDVVEEGAPRAFQADPIYLRAVLSNLFQNAVKYSKGRETVRVALDHKPDSLIIQVEDHGIGIPEEALATIFEPFRRAKNAEAMTGSGLGLAVARSAVRSMGGDIKVASELNRGTIFTVELPREVKRHKRPLEDEVKGAA